MFAGEYFRGKYILPEAFRAHIELLATEARIMCYLRYRFRFLQFLPNENKVSISTNICQEWEVAFLKVIGWDFSSFAANAETKL